MSKENVAGTVLSRLTGGQAKAIIMPGIIVLRRTKPIKCSECGEDILKGDMEAQVASKASSWGLAYSHYHENCFWKKLTNGDNTVLIDLCSGVAEVEAKPPFIKVIIRDYDNRNDTERKEDEGGMLYTEFVVE